MINQEKLLEFIIKNPRSTFIQIARGVRIPIALNRELTKILGSLQLDGKIIQNNNDKSYTAIRKIGTVKGKLNYGSEGRFGFILSEEGEEKEKFFVPGINFNGALDGDVVEADVFDYADPKEDKKFSTITKIIERSMSKVFGVLELKNSALSFRPIHKKYKGFSFKIDQFLVDARIDDLVQAEIVEYNEHFLKINIIKKITQITDPLCYLKVMLVTANAPEGFENNVINEANKIPDTIDEAGMRNRTDYRHELIVTIDGDDTKDFDDAISVKRIDQNTYELGVFIADVSYYVKENSAIDNEAYKRGTSTYLANTVIPMLPEKLSNGICSLNPNEDRFVIAAIMTINRFGQTIKTEIKPGIITSKYRLTYNRVNEFLSAGKRFDDKELNKMLNAAFELSTIIRKVKNDEGYLDFEIEEPKAILDENGRVIDVITKKPGPSENMIEDFMVRANEAVATFLTRQKLPVLYRIHEKPNDEKITYFKDVLKTLGIKIPDLSSDNVDPKSFSEVVYAIKEQRFDSFLKALLLRTMSKAVYSPDNIGHFGLAIVDYCHFTSPIRRYPDLIIHRIIRDIIFYNDRTKIDYFAKQLPIYGADNSECEQRAMQLERDTNDLMFAEYYRDKIGQSFNAQILSITAFGMFVEFENKTDALVHISTLTDDKYVPNDNLTELRGELNKNRYRLGEKVSVVITQTDPINGKVDAVLTKNYDQYYQNLKRKMSNKPKGKYDKQH